MRTVPYAALSPPPSQFSWVPWAVNPDLWEERMKLLFSDRLRPRCSELPWSPGLLPASQNTDTFALFCSLASEGTAGWPTLPPCLAPWPPGPPFPRREEDPRRSRARPPLVTRWGAAV